MTIERTPPAALDVERAVTERYAAGARSVQASLCCPTRYDDRYLAAIPEEILGKDYGCGDPSRWVGPGDVALDLGSGAGKICYILAQRVGPKGRVIGVDMNDEMLALARRHRAGVAERLGFDNVRFVKGRIQDLALDLEKLEGYLSAHTVRDLAELSALESEIARLRLDEPLVPDASVDVIVSNCVLNLVRPQDKERLFAEMFRVLRRGGRAVISDIVSDEDVPEHLTRDPELWSGCISGAFREDQFLDRFERAGFYGIEVLERQDAPWQTVEGIEFRSVTVRAFRGKEGPCLERNQAVVYRGPWRRVVDDDGHTFSRGRRVAVCDKTYGLMTDPNGPYGAEMFGIEPREEVPLEKARAFDCNGAELRSPRVTKGDSYDVTTDPAGECCGPDGC